jgi:hypothetical protein
MNRNRNVAAASKTAALTGGVLVATQHPVLMYVAAATILIPVTVLVLAAIVPRRKYCRDTAYAVLTLIVGLLRPHPSPSPEQAAHELVMLATGSEKLRSCQPGDAVSQQASERSVGS